MRAEDARTARLGGGQGRQRPIQIPRAIKSRQRLDRDVLDRVAVVLPKAVTNDAVRSPLGQGPEACALQELSSQFAAATIPLSRVAVLGSNPRQVMQNLLAIGARPYCERRQEQRRGTRNSYRCSQGANPRPTCVKISSLRPGDTWSECGRRPHPCRTRPL